MKKLLIGSIMALSFVAFIGCNDTAVAGSTESKSMKCGEGKCGGDKKAEKTMKCGANKKDAEGNASKCGGDKKATEANSSKCGGDKK